MYFLLCSGFRNIFLITFLCFAYKIKSSFVENHGHFLKCWLVLGGFLCVFSQSETICNLHSCCKFALVLQKNCIPFSVNQNWVIFSCILSVLEYLGFEPTPLWSVRADSEFMDELIVPPRPSVVFHVKISHNIVSWWVPCGKWKKGD